MPPPATTSDRITASLSASMRVTGELPRSAKRPSASVRSVLIGGGRIHGITTISSHDA